MTEIKLISPEIKVDGAPMNSDWYDALIYMRIERGLNVVGRTVLRFADDGYKMSSSMALKLGSNVDITADGAALFSGIVTGSTLDQVQGRYPELVVTVDDPAIKLSLVTRVKSVENAKFSDLVGQMCSPVGLSADATTDSIVHKYLMQHGTDLAFLDTIVRRANWVWWVDGKSLKVREAGKSSGEATVSFDKDLVEFSVRASALRPVDVQVNGWDYDAQAELTAKSSTPSVTATSTFVDGYTGTGTKKGLGLTALLVEGGSNPVVADEATVLANSSATRAHSDAVVARGTCLVNPAIAPYVKITVQSAGPSSGKYVATEVEHVYSRHGFYTKFVAGPVRPNGLVDSLGAAPQDAGFGMPSLITAKVDNIDDPAGLGRVRIAYTGAGGKVVGNWARVVSLGGGSSRGSYFLPEVNDEVLVGFERGDARHPVVIGGLFSKTATIAGDDAAIANGKVAYRRITSRNGHKIELSDGTSDDKQHILMELKNGHKLRLGQDKVTLDVANGPFTMTVGQAKFEIDASGNITIKGMKISLKADTDIELNGTNIKGKANAQLSLEGSATAELKGGGQTTVQASGQTAIKGAMVMIN